MKVRTGFALWLTGLPASGKSSIARGLAARLRELSVPVVVLGSDEMRTIFTPRPDYTEDERSRFYRQLVLTGEHIVRNGVNVIFDATANKRAFRTDARERIDRFAEIYVRTPLELCMKRDPKGIYASARERGTGTVPGMQAVYEEPVDPEIVADGTDFPALNVERILEFIKQRHYI